MFSIYRKSFAILFSNLILCAITTNPSRSMLQSNSVSPIQQQPPMILSTAATLTIPPTTPAPTQSTPAQPPQPSRPLSPAASTISTTTTTTTQDSPFISRTTPQPLISFTIIGSTTHPPSEATASIDSDINNGSMTHHMTTPIPTMTTPSAASPTNILPNNETINMGTNLNSNEESSRLSSNPPESAGGSTFTTPSPNQNASLDVVLEPRRVAEDKINISADQNSSNMTQTDRLKVHILKPKSKFKCTQPSDCQNDALCHNGRCFCTPGFTGDACDVNIDECRQAGKEACMNNGTCVDEVNGYRCDCPLGFRGDRCQDLADMCNDFPCLNDAKCINHMTHYTCKCEPGWEGKHCETNTDDCAKNPCQNNARCTDLVNDYRCECAPGFSGVNCETNLDDCINHNCQNNATCHDLVNDYECSCPAGFTGKLCDENIDDCANSPCYHGECTDLINGYECNCHDGYTGRNCDMDINECESIRSVCLNGATCENREPGFYCHCREGYTGKKCTDISDFCKAKQPCGKFGACKNINSPKGLFQCECQSGYIGSKCEQRRDCHNQCGLQQHAHCVNNVTCACLPGRREMCEYVSSCEQIEGDLCLHGGQCQNLETGGYQCQCPESYHGPICQFVTEKPQFDAILLVIMICVGFLIAACAIVSLIIFRTIRKARATRGTYSPSSQEKFGNSASDLLKPPIPERLI